MFGAAKPGATGSKDGTALLPAMRGVLSWAKINSLREFFLFRKKAKSLAFDRVYCRIKSQRNPEEFLMRFFDAERGQYWADDMAEQGNKKDPKNSQEFQDLMR
jgi:hypothetical protein